MGAVSSETIKERCGCSNYHYDLMLRKAILRYRETCLCVIETITTGKKYGVVCRLFFPVLHAQKSPRYPVRRTLEHVPLHNEQRRGLKAKTLYWNLEREIRKYTQEFEHDSRLRISIESSIPARAIEPIYLISHALPLASASPLSTRAPIACYIVSIRIYSLRPLI